jgi:hypothetical protein
MKQLKGKLKLKAEALTKQEKSVLELERAEENGRHVVEEKAQEVLRSKEREERQRQDIEDLKKKLAEAHEVLRSNHDVIEYLNRQLTERDLKSLPPVVAGLAGESEREIRGNALTDLLKRTEALGKGPQQLAPSKLMGLRAGAGFSPHSTTFNFTGLSELGLGSLASGGLGGTAPGLVGQTSSHFSLTSAGSAQPVETTAGALGVSTAAVVDTSAIAALSGFHSSVLGTSSASAVASVAAGRDPLSGPVAYRSPAANSPIAVK